MATILASVKDIGGMNAVLPVVKELKSRGHTVYMVAEGKSAELHRADMAAASSGYSDESRFCRGSLTSDLLLTDMSSGGGENTLVLLKRCKGKIPVVSVQDFWGARLKTDWANARPDYICVNDSVGADIVRKAWPDFSVGSIVVTGYPWLDKYAGAPRADVGAIRERLGIPKSYKVVVYIGQVWATGITLCNVVRVLGALVPSGGAHKKVPRIALVVCPHPRMKENTKEIVNWENALSYFTSDVGRLVLPSLRNMSLADVLPAADLVIGMYSTGLVEAAVLRKEVIAVLFPEYGLKAFRDETGGLMSQFPLTELKCAAYAYSPNVLEKYLTSVLVDGNSLGLKEAQEKELRCDGKHASRVATFVERVLKTRK